MYYQYILDAVGFAILILYNHHKNRKELRYGYPSLLLCLCSISCRKDVKTFAAVVLFMKEATEMFKNYTNKIKTIVCNRNLLDDHA